MCFPIISATAVLTHSGPLVSPYPMEAIREEEKGDDGAAAVVVVVAAAVAAGAAAAVLCVPGSDETELIVALDAAVVVAYSSVAYMSMS